MVRLPCYKAAVETVGFVRRLADRVLQQVISKLISYCSRADAVIWSVNLVSKFVSKINKLSFDGIITGSSW